MKKITMKRWFKNLCLFFSGIIFVLLIKFVVLFSDRIRKEVDVPSRIQDTLLSIIAVQTETGDAPIVALITYEDSIISIGYNTVKKEHDFTGHAEINAINNAISSIGYDEFYNLDKDKMVLYTTYEPCLMCRGAISHMDIHKVVILFKKDFSNNLKQEWRNVFKYHFYKRIGNISESDKSEYYSIIEK
jgi:tRNA(Arg) A34 adenosine deaminase TadA